MSKADVIEIEGTVTEKLPNTMFKVQLETDMRYWRISAVSCVRISSRSFRGIRLLWSFPRMICLRDALSGEINKNITCINFFGVLY